MSEIDWKAKAQAAIVTLHKEALAADDCFQVMDGVDPRTILALFELTGIAPKGLAQTAPLSAPMTISLEEHVARAIKPLRVVSRRKHGLMRDDEYFIVDDASDVGLAGGEFTAGPFSSFNVACEQAKLINARAAIAAVREREGATPSDGAIYAAVSRRSDPEGYDRMLDEITADARAVLAVAPDPAEAMRARCEAIARGYADHFPATVILGEDYHKGRRSAGTLIATAIAALKGNGEGR